MTLRFRPGRPLEAGQGINVTVETGFTAMDGSGLAEPVEGRTMVERAGRRTLAVHAKVGVAEAGCGQPGRARGLPRSPTDATCVPRLGG